MRIMLATFNVCLHLIPQNKSLFIHFLRLSFFPYICLLTLLYKGAVHEPHGIV